MPSSNSDGPYYSCICLNVRIRTTSTTALPPLDWSTDKEYTQVFVGEDGITVAHPQVTLRIRTRGVPIAGTSRCARYTSLTCLICQALVYRVHQVVPIDVEGKDGPLLPTEDWVEEEIMKSSSGWLDIHKECLTGDAITQAESSARYSATFSLVLPSPTPSPSSPEPPNEQPSSRSSPTIPSTPPRPYLSNMRPLFPPPPFTPSHPVFIHLSTLASNQSQQIRSAAEEYLAQAVRDKITEIEHAEKELKQHVEILWKTSMEGVTKVEQERSQNLSRSPVRRNRETESWSGINGTGSPTYGTPVAIRNFVPIQAPLSRTAPPQSLPRISSLSASLATSSFDHPRAQQEGQSPQSIHDLPRPHSSTSNRSSGSSGSSRTLSSHSASSKTISIRPPPAEGSNVLQFRRNTNDAINTAASFKYFVNLEEDMARHRRREKDAAKKDQDQGQASEAGPSQGATSSTNGNGTRKHKKTRSGSQLVTEDSTTRNQRLEGEGEEAPGSHGPENGSKGKRKVTFDIQPAIVTIKREVNAEKEEEAALAGQDVGEMIFDLEDEGSERSISDSRPMLPLVEQPGPLRPRIRPSRNNAVVLPESFLSLRPASLPAPSHIRPPRGHHGIDSSSSQAAMLATLPRPTSNRDEHRRSRSTREPEPAAQEHEEALDLREAEILKLVAANTPSHRGAWKRDSKAWQTFVRRQDAKDQVGDGQYIQEEGDDADEDGLALGVSEMSRVYNGRDVNDSDDETKSRTMFVGSVPIAIRSNLQPKETLSLASYQPKAVLSSLSVQQPAGSSGRPNSSAALRKASYAERDRSRLMDPGALDFAAEEDEEEVGESSEDEDDTHKTDGDDVGGRGRKRALKILQARSELPAAGMWRSLA